MSKAKLATTTALLITILGVSLPYRRALGAENQVPEKARKQLQGAFGSSFLVFRGPVQEELKLSDEQKQKLDQEVEVRAKEGMQFFQKLEGADPEEREEELGEYRRTVDAKIAAFVKTTLNDEQRKRLRQIQLQAEGAFALGNPKIADEVILTDAQRMRFASVVQEFQKKLEPVIKQAQAEGNPEEIRPKAMKIRKEHEAKIEAILTDAQKKRWAELLGKPFRIDD
jgi:vacuolar-type H+-ATPase subunit H